jgi:hypothetical protein
VDRTAELRWFFRRSPPAPVTAWFKAAQPPRSRTDTYLVVPGTDAVGIKTRGGTTRLELKLRPAPPSPLALADSVSGQVEQWQRWSCPRPAITRLLPRLGLPRDRWVKVGKTRRMVTIPYRGEAGCRVELTALEVEGGSWSTVGLEAFGPEPDLVPALQAAAEQFFGPMDLPGGLGADRSGGYPAWLAML